MSRSALTRSVDKLEAEGYLRRERCSHDERGAYGVLTRKGQRALAEARPVYWAGIKKYFAGNLTEADISNLERILEKIPSEEKRQEKGLKGRPNDVKGRPG